ncbi:hypothetical protein A5731_09255 [Mycolicibacterium conceptionense]|uniref:Uncharacterized protein n=2 Tax=Mycolicibacterium TaxID=1866885 RepID=A0A0U1CWL5_9MYCO|nr:hypothetical protein [Mycolicibacterium conceptionense]OBB12983.1 hypothetical protein A5718_00355 [Mycolicibacterium conceptionense]OBF06248.1 hypothetical protein A5731_09255 [Mycolicibacterium conceptionense]OBF25707.1 hypothetical protein A5726_06715 [Mycolicibacterium conceptionense]OBF43523.1 hypothetical protein A5720_12995 [Mycolicibacterium conceptionense]OBH96736.1 hypothetical protein A5716_17380 [Mycolicibacterium conceptionense]
MHPGTPSSVPVPLLVYAVASRGEDAELHPLQQSTVTLNRSAAEAELAESNDQHAVLIEQRILPWAPATDIERRPALYEYTVGYHVADHYVPWGLALSTDRSAVETELATVQAAIAESNIGGSFGVLMLERPIFPWYIARPRAVPLK